MSKRFKDETEVLFHCWVSKNEQSFYSSKIVVKSCIICFFESFFEADWKKIHLIYMNICINKTSENTSELFVQP